MKKILIIKTSSLGDVVHMLPAITDAKTRYPEVQIDWVVEEGFADIPKWHPAIAQVYPVAIRRWRKALLKRETQQEIKQFKQSLKSQQYDAIIDTQGLLKSAWVSRWANGTRYGYNRHSAREPLASWFYHKHFPVDRERHAITRNRLLLAHVLDYSIVNLPLDYGVELPIANKAQLPEKPYIVALHGTSRLDKEWSIQAWHNLLDDLQSHDLNVLFPWGNETEKQRAKTLAETHANAVVLPRCALTELAVLLRDAVGVIGMDTGLMHVAAALGKAGIALYPVTAPELTGVMRAEQAQGNLDTFRGEQVQDIPAVIQQLKQNLNLSN